MFILSTILLGSCEITKRRYANGWYISKPSWVRNTIVTEKNERVNKEANKQELVDIADTISESSLSVQIERLPTVTEIEVKREPLLMDRFQLRSDTVQQQIIVENSFNNKAFLIGEYTTFGAAMITAGIGLAILSNLVVPAIILLATAIILYILSVVISQIAIKRIRKQNLDHKIWPHALVLGVTLEIFCLATAAIVALIAALAFANPTVTIVAGVVTFVLLSVVVLSKI